MDTESLEKSNTNNETEEVTGLLTVEQAAKFLNITVGALKDWTKLKENACPCYRYKSRVLRFEKSEILAWFKEQTKTWRDTKGLVEED